ncbi:ABC-three component system middle component 6 [Parahaliea aestuarii]|uniref:ABC-three component system middle component 6 n=1 Tax=Parahaliea aestuarii TaxID=1852021 RepID=UPI003CCC840E
MIVSKDVNPERDLYFLGARVIELLDHSGNGSDSFLDIFQQLNADNDISMNLYVLTLDWLYLLGAVKEINDGIIKKCF